MELSEFDYSVRVQLASSRLCEQQTPSVALKLQLKDARGEETPVMLELDAGTLDKVLKQFDAIRAELDRRRRAA